MAKAFFKEDTVPDEGPVLPARPSEPLPLTPRGRERLEAERRAIDPADEGQLTRRLVLDRVLASSFVRAPSLHDGGVGFGCTVEVQDARGRRRTYELVGPDEVDPSEGRISFASPIGEALLGAREGEEVSFERDDGEEVRLVVKRVWIG